MSTNIAFILPATAQELTIIEEAPMENHVIATIVASYDKDGVPTVSIEYAASFLSNFNTEDRIDLLHLAVDAIYIDTSDDDDLFGDEDEEWNEQDYA